MNPLDERAETLAPGVCVASDGSEWCAWRRGDGRITGFVEVRRHYARGRLCLVTIPGATRSIEGPVLDLALATGVSNQGGNQ